MSTLFEAELDVSTPAVSALTERISGFLEAGSVDPRTAHHVVLVCDEILTNVAEHGGSGVAAAVRVMIEPSAVNGEISDTGMPFDPRGAATPDINAGIDNRPVGGLGLFLIHRLTDRFDYARRDGRNCTRFSIPRRPASTKGAS
ncbi:MAG: ATP-binding protein [Pseudolabrys sp.]